MRIIPESPEQYSLELKPEFEVEDLHDLWISLDDINEPCCLIPKADDQGNYFLLVHPHEF